MPTLRVVTYNVHKCQGLDRRVRPERIAAVLRELDADVIALQEVVSRQSGDPHDDQARFLAQALGDSMRLGENRLHDGASYGNVTLSRPRIEAWHNYDVSARGRERRGCLRTDIAVNGGGMVHLFNVHLGTAFMERREQARKLISDAILEHPELEGHRIVLGDFNEWTRGLATRTLTSLFESVDIYAHLKRRRTYPGIFPFLHLDHIYYEGSVEVRGLELPRSRKSLMASDHLPLIADLRIGF